VRIVQCTDARCVGSLRTTALSLLSRRLAVLVVDLHDLVKLDDDAARALSDLARCATEQGTAVRMIGGQPAAGQDVAAVWRMARPA
jgi:hypothetical protein